MRVFILWLRDDTQADWIDHRVIQFRHEPHRNVWHWFMGIRASFHHVGAGRFRLSSIPDQEDVPTGLPLLTDIAICKDDSGYKITLKDEDI